MTPVRDACVIGWPIAHSRSPLIHNYWLRRYGLAGRYDRMPVRPEELTQFLERVRRGDYVGCNVTIPHKETVVRQVTIRDSRTARIGAVNTLYRSDGELVGLNTDAGGFLGSLQAAIPEWTGAGETLIILGAGGAARAIAAALLSHAPASILVFNRTYPRAAVLAADFGPPVAAEAWERLSHWLPRAHLLVNATSLGMSGQPPLELSLAPLKTGAVVVDIVYVPLETPLLAEARAGGHKTVDGLGMLLHQAAPGFERWFGVAPEITNELRELVVADLPRPPPC